MIPHVQLNLPILVTLGPDTFGLNIEVVAIQMTLINRPAELFNIIDHIIQVSVWQPRVIICARIAYLPAHSLVSRLRACARVGSGEGLPARMRLCVSVLRSWGMYKNTE